MEAFSQPAPSLPPVFSMAPLLPADSQLSMASAGLNETSVGSGGGGGGGGGGGFNPLVSRLGKLSFLQAVIKTAVSNNEQAIIVRYSFIFLLFEFGGVRYLGISILIISDKLELLSSLLNRTPTRT